VTGPYTVREFLAADLAPARRMAALQELCEKFTGEPLDVTTASLRDALADRIGMEDFRRLHILISHLYHACGASIPLTTELRAEVNVSLARRGQPAGSAPERG
jgi:hypothetical protein